MTMLRRSALVPCEIDAGAEYNEYGERDHVCKPTQARCQIVRLNNQKTGTSFQSRESASLGRAEFNENASVLLFPPEYEPKVGDVIKLKTGRSKHSLQVRWLEDRYDVNGVFDHWECRCEQ